MTEQRINVESIYGRDNRMPLVNMTLPGGKDRISLRVTEARDLAANLLQAAEAALGDGFMIEFMRNSSTNPDTREAEADAARLMVTFRMWRRKYEFPEDAL